MKIAMGTGKRRKGPPEERLSVEKVADRFNQVLHCSYLEPMRCLPDVSLDIRHRPCILKKMAKLFKIVISNPF